MKAHSHNSLFKLPVLILPLIALGLLGKAVLHGDPDIFVYPDFVVNIVIDDIGNYKRTIPDPRYRAPEKEDVEYMLHLAEENGCPLVLNIIFSDRELTQNWGWRSYFTWLPPLLRAHPAHEYTIHGRNHKDFVEQQRTAMEMSDDLRFGINELKSEGLTYHYTHVLPDGVFDRRYLHVARELGIRTIRAGWHNPYLSNFFDKCYLILTYKLKINPLRSWYDPYHNHEGVRNDIWITYWDYGNSIPDVKHKLESDRERERYFQELHLSIDEGNLDRWSPWSWMLHWFNFIGKENSLGAILLKEAFDYIQENYADEVQYLTLWQTGEYFRELQGTKLAIHRDNQTIEIEIEKPSFQFDTPVFIRTSQKLVTEYRWLKLKGGYKIYIPRDLSRVIINLE